MGNELRDIQVSFISLVKAGANKKSIIFKGKDKSSDDNFNLQFEIKKTNEKEGIVYGIVYSPNQVDTDGDFAKAEEIKKASYNFMKSQNTINIDKDHSFEKQDAFVCESWIVRKDDSIFSDEPIGSWAVGIKVEDDELKKSIEDGSIAGISMAGYATKTEVVKSDDEVSKSMDTYIEEMKKVFNSLSVDIRGYWYEKNIKKGDEEMDEKLKEFMENTTKAIKAVDERMGKIEEELKAIKGDNKDISKELSKSKQMDEDFKKDDNTEEDWV